jgi:cytochrome c oxidase subunit 4
METTSPPAPDHNISRYHLFVSVAMLLAFITGAEIVAIWLPWVHWLLIGLLVIMSAVKFSYVIFVFMHLRWDRAFCTILFLIGMILAGGTAWALLRLFNAPDSVPLSSQVESAPAPAAAPAPAKAK